jgi:hypothetical protein
MCTLLTLSREIYERMPGAVNQRIISDAKSNRDGYSLVLVSKGRENSIVRTMSPDLVLSLLAVLDWDRFFLHSRMATQGAVDVVNTHGWASRNGVLFMHNGCLRNKNAAKYPVDSQLIGRWLDEGGLKVALRELKEETFANVFFIDTMNKTYVVARSQGGTLYTDAKGNYSTVFDYMLGMTTDATRGSNNLHMMFAPASVPIPKPKTEPVAVPPPPLPAAKGA